MTGSFAVVTGPIAGTVTLPDGAEVDVTAGVVYVDSAEQAAAVADAIGQRYAAEGHPTDETFQYTP